MADFGELLQATTTGASLLVLFIPSADRDGNALGKELRLSFPRRPSVSHH